MSIGSHRHVDVVVVAELGVGVAGFPARVVEIVIVHVRHEVETVRRFAPAHDASQIEVRKVVLAGCPYGLVEMLLQRYPERLGDDVPVGDVAVYRRYEICGKLVHRIERPLGLMRAGRRAHSWPALTAPHDPDSTALGSLSVTRISIS